MRIIRCYARVKRRTRLEDKVENFEFDKLVGAIIAGLLVLVFSINIGGVIYGSNIPVNVPGYKIEVDENAGSGGGGAPAELPAVLDLVMIFAKADAHNGQQVFNKCAVCHTNGKGDANKVGPNLWNIVNAKVAKHNDFEYSAAMKAYGETGAVWSFEHLYRYLFSPKKMVPGTKMAFAGLKKDQERADVIAYLATLSDSPVPLPK